MRHLRENVHGVSVRAKEGWLQVDGAQERNNKLPVSIPATTDVHHLVPPLCIGARIAGQGVGALGCERLPPVGRATDSAIPAWREIQLALGRFATRRDWGIERRTANGHRLGESDFKTRGVGARVYSCRKPQQPFTRELRLQ